MYSITVSGNAGSNPRPFAYTTREGEVKTGASINIAVNNPRPRNEETEWVQLTFFGKLADVANRYLHKGDKICAIGTPYAQCYAKRDGTYAAMIQVNVSSFDLPPKSASNGPAEAPAVESEPVQTTAAARPAIPQTLPPEVADVVGQLASMLGK